MNKQKPTDPPMQKTRWHIYVFTGIKILRHEHTVTSQNSCAHTETYTHMDVRLRPGPAGFSKAHVG